MYKDKKIAALIPARSGSTRVKDKNIRPLDGKPLILHTLNSCAESALLDGVYISSDSTQICQHGMPFGAKPIYRPPEISDSTSSTELAIMHSIESGLSQYDYIMLLQPTSPIRNRGRIDDAIRFLVDGKFQSIVSVFPDPMLWWVRHRNKPIPSYNIHDRPRSQDHYVLEETGSIYIFNVESFVQSKSRIIYPVGLFEMRSIGENIDIDEEIDFYIAETCIQKREQYGLF